MLFLLAPQSKIQDIQERQQRNHKPNRHVIGPDYPISIGAKAPPATPITI